MPPSPRPGTLEWLADRDPDHIALVTPEGALTRGDWEARAAALAEHLAQEREVAPGGLLSASGRIGPHWLVVSWAAAKLGAATAPAGERRLSGASAPPDSVAFSRLGRPVRRHFTPGGVAAIGVTLSDLVARLHAVPGTTLVVSGPVSDPVATLLVNLVLVGGGRVVAAPAPEAALGLAAEHGAGLAALPPAEIDALSLLAPAALDALDLTSIQTLVTGAAPTSPAGRDAAVDLFGADAVVDVYATADTGVVAVRGRDQEHHVLLDGVSVRNAAGLLEVRSPLCAAAGWVPTGDRAALVGDTALQLL